MTRIRALTLALAVIAFLAMLVAGPGTRLGWFPWQVGLGLMRFGAYAGLAAAAVGLVLVVLLAVPRWRARPWVPVLSICIGLAAAAPPIILLNQARGVPPIHDITTDANDPPAFEALRAVREKSPNGFAYGGAEVARAQQRFYADIKPAVVPQPPREAMQRALDAARAMGWEIVATDTEGGRLEATATTRWFGFKDDVVVRIRPEAAGSRIDVRSMSRVGRSDLGANAARVREFLGRLA